MSSEIKAKEDPTYENLGYDPYLTRSLQSLDPNYQTSEDFNLMTEGSAIGSAMMEGTVYAKTIIVREESTNLDRLILGYYKDGF